MLFIKNTWSGDVTYQEIASQFTRKQLQKMDTYLLEHPIYLGGLPEEAITPEFEKEGEHEDGLLLLQMIVNLWD
jgi:hypothetical protein